MELIHVNIEVGVTPRLVNLEALAFIGVSRPGHTRAMPW